MAEGASDADRSSGMAIPAPRLYVPEEYRVGLIALAGLDQGSVDQIFDVLQRIPPSLTPGNLLPRIAAAVPIRGDVLDSVVTALLSLYRASEDIGRDLREIAAQISESPDLDLGHHQRELLRSRLVYLTQSESLMVKSKAVGIATASERPYHGARIITEVRPIFLQDASRPPAAAVLVHTLIVAFHTASGYVEEAHFALDIGDVKMLARTLERAQAKDESLRGVLRAASVRLLENGE
jgi:hypothetical protein